MYNKNILSTPHTSPNPTFIPPATYSSKFVIDSLSLTATLGLTVDLQLSLGVGDISAIAADFKVAVQKVQFYNIMLLSANLIMSFTLCF